MIYNKFPISGLLKEPLLIMESFIVFFFLELAAILWMRVKSEKINELKIQEKAYIWLFFGYAIMWFFIIIADYYLESLYLRTFFLNIGFFIQIICVLIFIKIIEKYRIFLKRYLFTKIYIVFTLFYIFILCIAVYYATFIASVFWIIFFLFFTIYLKELSSDLYIKRELRNLKLDFLKFYLGVILTSLGYQLTTRFIVEIMGLSIRLIGDILQLVGLIFLSWFFITLPSFSEYYLKIYIIDDTGTTIFSYETAIKESIGVNSALLSNLILALQSLVKNIREDLIRVVEMGNDKFFITKEMSTSYIFILKTNRDADSEFINSILKEIKDKFVEKFMGYFSLAVDEKIELFISFKEDIKEILRDKTNLDNL